MVNSGRNRFELEDGGDRDIFTEDSDAVFQTSAVPRERRRKKLRYLIITSALLFFTGVFGFLLYKTFNDDIKTAWNSITGLFSKDAVQDKSKNGQFLDEKIRNLDLESLKERYFFPAEKVSPPLASAVSAYRENDRSRALREFEKFLESSSDDREKAIALVYMGIMALETERYQLAKHHLERALKYNEKSVAALVNLAIAEQKMGNLDDAKNHIARAEELDPKNPDISIIAGNLLAAGRDLDAAVEKYKSGIDNSEKDPMLHFNLALSLLRGGKYEEAILYFSKTIEIAGPGEISARSHAHLGQIYFSRGNYEMAADHLQQSVTQAPDNGRYLYNLGIVYLNLKQPEKALEYFKRALDAGSGEAIVFRSLASAFRDINESALAVRALRKALYRNPEDTESWFLLGDIYLEEKDLNSAAEAYKKIVNMTPGDSSTRDALIKLGSVYTELERFNDALDAYGKAVEMDPDNVKARYGLGKVYYHSGNKDFAAREWKRALVSPSDGASHPPLSRDEERIIRIALGLMYKEEGAYDMSLGQFRLIQSRNMEPPVIPEDPELSLYMADVYSLLKDRGTAIKHYTDVVESRSAHPEQRKKSYMEMARLQAETGKIEDLEYARSNAAKAVRMDPNDENASITQAEILLKSNSLSDRERAIEILLTVTSSDITSKTASRAHNILGKAYYANGEYSRALRAFEYSYQLDPTNPEAYANQRAAANAYEQSLRR